METAYVRKNDIADLFTQKGHYLSQEYHYTLFLIEDHCWKALKELHCCLKFDKGTVSLSEQIR